MKSLRKPLAMFMSIVMILSMVATSVFAGATAVVNDAEVGSESNPENASNYYNSMVKYYILNPQLSEGDADGYWYEYKVEKNGIFSLENSSSNGVDYQIVVDDGTHQYYAYDGAYNNPVSTYRLRKGDIVKINIYAQPDENGNIPATKVYASFKMVSATSDTDPISLKSIGYKAYVKAGDFVYFTDSTRTAAYCGSGLVISGYAPAIAETVVTVSGKTYTDTDGDGKIELKLSGDYYSRPFIEIANNFESDTAYTFKVTASAAEGAFCSCGGSLDHIEAIEACHLAGTKEYWYCGKCDSVYADEYASQVTNRMNLMVPADTDLVHVDAVAPDCYNEGKLEYWYCPDCGGHYLDAEGTVVTNSKSVILPAAHTKLVNIEAAEPDCHYIGNIEYWVCYDCEGVWADEALTQVTNSKNVILPAKGSDNIVHFDKVEPGCHSIGNIEYWYCPDCDQFWQDEALTQLTNAKNVILPAKGSHNIHHFEAKEPSCYEMGNIEYWYCPDCEGFWADEALTRITNSKSVILPETHTNLVHFDAVEPDCHRIGNIEYWYCADCEGFWQDGALRQITNSKNVIIPAKGSDKLVHFDKVEPGCHYIGNIEYWYCPDCEQFWQDAALTQLTNSKNVILPATSTDGVQHFEAKEPNCYEQGNEEYWYCSECECFWADEALTQITNSKRVILPVTHENLAHIKAVEPACHYNGNVEYWVCYDCEGVWTDASFTKVSNIKNVILPATGSENVQHVDAKAPTCHENGNVEYWFCADCEQFWTNEALTELTNSKNVLIGATGEHVWADDFTVDREPADGVDGEKSKHCTTEGCDARTEITAIPATFKQTVNGVETEVASGTKVTITTSKVTVDGLNGYAFDYWVVESENVTLDMDVTVLENSYTMPNEDVVINSVTYLIGDCDGDGMVTGSDLIVLQSAIKNGEAATKYLDINNDGILAATDIMVLNQIIKGNYNYSDYQG